MNYYVQHLSPCYNDVMMMRSLVHVDRSEQRRVDAGHC